MVNADIGIGAALVDAPEHLVGIYRIRQAVEPGVFRLTADKPAVSPIHALLDVVPGRGIFDALVKGHADVAAQIGLDLHALLRPHEDLVAVDMGGEIHALLLDLPQGGQTEHLESAGVRQNGAVPGHEFVQAAHLPHHRIRGPQMQMVGIAQLHLAADIFQVLRTEGALNGTLGANVHKHRGLHRAVGAGKHTPPGLPLGFQQFKHRLPLSFVSPIYMASPKLKNRYRFSTAMR